MKNIETRKGLLVGALVLGLAGMPGARASLVAFYDFENDVLDSSANANNGTVTGTATYSTDVATTINSRSTKSFSFNGSTYITLPHAGIDFYDRAQSTGATISMWVSAVPGDEDTLFSESSSSSNTPLYNLQIGDSSNGTDDQARLFVRDDAGSNSNLGTGNSTVFESPAVWHHLLLTDDDGTVNLYIDGVLDTSTDLDYSLGTTSLDTTTLGRITRPNPFGNYTGLMDEVAIYDTVLSSSDIASLAGGTSPTAIPEPSAAYLLGALGGMLLLRRRRA